MSEELSKEESELEQGVRTCMWCWKCALNLEVGLESHPSEKNTTENTQKHSLRETARKAKNKENLKNQPNKCKQL